MISLIRNRASSSHSALTSTLLITDKSADDFDMEVIKALDSDVEIVTDESINGLNVENVDEYINTYCYLLCYIHSELTLGQIISTCLKPSNNTVTHYVSEKLKIAFYNQGKT
jgi:hypothetical protein